jgi:hypothetical protein
MGRVGRWALLAIGELDDAVSVIRPQRTTWANEIWYFWDAAAAPLRRDACFKGLVRGAGLVDYCHRRGDDFYCRQSLESAAECPGES